MIIFVHMLGFVVLLIAGSGMNSYGDLSDMALQNMLALADTKDPGDGEEP